MDTTYQPAENDTYPPEYDTSEMHLYYTSELSFLDLLEGKLDLSGLGVNNDSLITAAVIHYTGTSGKHWYSSAIKLGSLIGLTPTEAVDVLYLNDISYNGASTVNRCIKIHEDGRISAYIYDGTIDLYSTTPTANDDTVIGNLFSLYEILGGVVTEPANLRSINNNSCIVDDANTNNYIDLQYYPLSIETLQEVDVRIDDINNGVNLGTVKLSGILGSWEGFSPESAIILNNFFKSKNLPLLAINVTVFQDGGEHSYLRILNPIQSSCQGISITGANIYSEPSHYGEIWDIEKNDITTTYMLSGGYELDGTPLAVKLVNTHKNDRKVILVPKDTNSSVSNYDGTELEMSEMENGSLAFCLAGNPCYGATPSMAVDINRNETFNVTIGGQEYLGLDINGLKAAFMNNGIEAIEFKPPYVCTPGEIEIPLTHEPYQVGDEVFITVMLDNNSNYGTQVIEDLNGNYVYLPEGMHQVSFKILENGVYFIEPDAAFHDMFMYSGIDLARQVGLNVHFTFQYFDKNGNEINHSSLPYNVNAPNTYSTGKIVIKGRSTSDLPDFRTVIEASEVTLRFIPTPSEYIFAESPRDFILESFGEEGISISTCAAQYTIDE